MPEPMPTGTRRIELLVREGLPTLTRQRQRDLTTTIEDLVESGAVASASVSTWAKRSPIDAQEGSDRYVSLREWAHDAGVTLSPFFVKRVCYCAETADYREYRVPPAFTLVVYEDDTVAGVYPHRGEQSRSVMDGIEALRADATTTPPAGPAPEETLAD